MRIAMLEILEFCLNVLKNHHCHDQPTSLQDLGLTGLQMFTGVSFLVHSKCHPSIVCWRQQYVPIEYNRSLENIEILCWPESDEPAKIRFMGGPTWLLPAQHSYIEKLMAVDNFLTKDQMTSLLMYFNRRQDQLSKHISCQKRIIRPRFF